MSNGEFYCVTDTDVGESNTLKKEITDQNNLLYKNII